MIEDRTRVEGQTVKSHVQELRIEMIFGDSARLLERAVNGQSQSCLSYDCVRKLMRAVIWRNDGAPVGKRDAI